MDYEPSVTTTSTESVCLSVSCDILNPPYTILFVFLTFQMEEDENGRSFFPTGSSFREISTEYLEWCRKEFPGEQTLIDECDEFWECVRNPSKRRKVSSFSLLASSPVTPLKKQSSVVVGDKRFELLHACEVKKKASMWNQCSFHEEL
jgi:hypothetical protein